MEIPALVRQAAARVLADDIGALNVALDSSRVTQESTIVEIKTLRSELRVSHAELRTSRYQHESTMVELRDANRLSGWNLIESVFGSKDAFDRGDMATIIQHCRVAALKNPLIGKGLRLRHAYIFGQGVTVSSPEEAVNAKLQAFLADRRNRTQITGSQGWEHLERERSTTGNVFIACVAASDGRAMATPQVRLIPMEQIQDIILNPDDAADPWFYLRTRIQGHQTIREWHPSLDLWRRGDHAIELPLEPGRQRERGEIMWDTPILHRKTGGFVDWQWGIPRVFPALAWAEAHTKFLSNWAAVVDLLGRNAVKIIGKGAGADQIASAKAKLQSGFVAGSSETNPLPAPGSAFVASDQWDISAFKARGAAVEVSDAKAFRLQIAAALDVPDHMLGDVDQGNLATATTLNRPTELGFLLDQEWYSELFDTLGTWAVTVQQREIRAADESLVTVEWPELLAADGNAAVERIAKALETAIPPHLEPALKELTRSILIAAGLENVDEILESAFDAKGDPLIPLQRTTPPATPAESRSRSTMLAVLEEVERLRAA